MNKITNKSKDTNNLDINIMIVEDEFIIALDLKDTLKRMGYKNHVIATYGLEAIDKALKFKPDLILMDIMLKGDLDGIQAAEKIRNKFDIPILFISSFSDNKSIEHAYRISPYGYLIKPFSKYDLEAAIDHAFKIQEEKNFHGYDKFYKSFYSRFN